MSVVSSDLVAYLSAGQPENDSDSSGGAIDLTMQLLDKTNSFGINSGSGDKLDFVSDNAADTQNCVVKGYGVYGEWLEETVALSGVSHVQTTNTYLNLASIKLASAANGSVVVARYNSGSPTDTIHTIPATEKGAACLFIKATANPSGGATKYFYEKFFYVNKNASSSLTSGVIYLSVDEDGELTMDLEMSSSVTVTGGSESTTNRVTEPTAGGTYVWGEHASQGAGHTIGDAEDGNLIPNEQQGVWVRLTLAAGRLAEQEVLWTPSIYGGAS